MINSEIIRLVNIIETEAQIQPYFKQLILELEKACKSYINSEIETTTDGYPIENGYAKSFDPLLESQELLNAWNRYGFVVGKKVVNSKNCQNAIHKILEIVKTLNMDLTDTKSFEKDINGTPIISRGFFELYHDDVLLQIRQSIRLYIFHVLLWKTPYLWTTFDRLGLKLPEGEESIGLPLHVDQNPTVHADFTTIQGVLALEDCPIERGTFVVVPGSVKHFKEYENFIKTDYKGEFVQLEESSKLFEQLSKKKQIIPLRAGDIVSWDSRTTHANSNNISNQNRYVCYISTGIAKEDNNEILEKRKNAFLSGLGENTRDAYLHASKKPRFTNKELINQLRTPEQFNILGECLYGIKKYKDLE